MPIFRALKAHFMKRFLLILALLPCFAFTQNDTGVTALYQFATVFREDQGSLRRYYQIPMSEERNQRFREFYSGKLQELKALDFEALSDGGKADHFLIRRYIRQQLQDLEEEQAFITEFGSEFDFMKPLHDLEAKRRRGKDLEGKDVAHAMDQMRRALEEKLQQFRETGREFNRQDARNAGYLLNGYNQALSSLNEFYTGYDPDYNWWVPDTSQALDSLLKEFGSYISDHIRQGEGVEDDGSGIVGYPIGRKELLERLNYELIAYSPEELITIAEREYAWCEARMKETAKEMGFGSDWKKALEAVKENHVPLGQQPEAMLDLYDQSVGFLKEHDLVSIPPIAEETWRMTMLSPEAQKISPFFLGGEVLQISYPTDAMEHEYKLMSMRGNNIHFSRAVIHHELIAGHHLQRFMMNRYKPYRFYYTPFWMEGWALYWEFLLWEMDFPRSPEDRMGMLFWRMHRAARIMFSLNYHLGKWTPQQCIDFLVDNVGHERSTAEGEVRRSFTGRYGPLYQIAYMIGALQFWELKKELVDEGDLSLKEFHDRVLHESAMPVTVLRELLTDAPFPREVENDWKFYPALKN